MDKSIQKNAKAIGIIIGIIVVVCIGIATATMKNNSEADNADNKEKTKFEAIERDSKITVDGSGNLQITRSKVEDTGKYTDGSWTFLMYMCGVDRPNYDYTGKSLDRIKNINVNSENIDKYNIVIQIGSNEEWYGDRYKELGTKQIKRMKLNADKEWDIVEDVGSANMGDYNTFIDFLEWGYTTYPAEHTVLVLYDHGGNSLGGVCYDPYNNDDCLTINEIEYSLAKTKKYMQNQLELIVFDACSAGSVEYANAVVPYAKYMLASPEFITAYGFDHGCAINGIIENPNIEPLELGRLYIKGFKTLFNVYKIPRNKNTAVVYDLGVLDECLVEMNNIFKQAYEYACTDKKKVKSFNNGVMYGYVYSSGAQVDIKTYLVNISEKVDTKKAIELIDKVCASYWFIGINKECGPLSMCYHKGKFGCGGLNRMRNLTFSPYYMNLIELTSHVLTGRSFETFNKYDWANSKYFYEDNFDFMNYSNYNMKLLEKEEIINIIKSNPDYISEGFIQNWIDNIDQKPINERTVSDTLKVDVNSNDEIITKVTENASEIEMAYNTIYADIQGTTICLGDNADATYNQEKGEVTTNFNGEWMMLGDGQLLTTYILQKQKDYVEYMIPVQANELESTLYVRVSKEAIEIDGICYAPKDSSHSNRMHPVEEGLVITPIYDVWNEAEKTYDTVYGEEYSIKGINDVLYTYLEDGEYSYATVVDDMLGTVLYSNPMKFTMKDKKIEFIK